MLNSKTNERELCYVITIDDIEPIQGSDNCEAAVIGGWKVMVRKNEFHKGDPAIYFEIDSKVDETNPVFAFLATKKYKVTTQKYTFGGKGNFISQGLLMSAADFNWTICNVKYPDKDRVAIVDDHNKAHCVEDETRFLTEQLKVTYATTVDNVRKAHSENKYKKMSQRHPKLFSRQPFRWLMKREWGRKFLFIFFGKAKDKKSGWPEWVQKTDEERIENMPYLLQDKNTTWIATEKIDGTSTTFTMKRGRWPHKYDFYVCSRNVVFDKPDKACFYDTNVYLEMAEKYNIEKKMKEILFEFPSFKKCQWITIQGETYGKSIQQRDYGMDEHNFMAFNFITSKDGRWNSAAMQAFLEHYFGIPCVPILTENYKLPDTIDELREYVDSDTSVIDDGMREGIVFRSSDATKSFKCVSPEYLLKYHQ